MHTKLATDRLISTICLLLTLLMAGPTWAQRTGDHIVPSIETVCDDDPFSFGLCNAYCEALDCDSATPIGTERACSRVLNNYLKKSAGAAPPCSVSACPCDFDALTDMPILVAAGDAEFAPPAIDPGTLSEYCGPYGPNGEEAFVSDAFQPEVPRVTPQGVRLFYWVEETPASCNSAGGLVDGTNLNAPDDWDYLPLFYDQKISLTSSELNGCRMKLQDVCAGINP